MIQYFRFIFYVFTGFFLFIFIYVTFFSDQYRGLKNIISHSDLWLFSIAVNEWNWEIISTKIQNKDQFDTTEVENIFVDKRSLLTTYFSSANGVKSFQLERTGSGEMINLWVWEYYFRLKDPSQKYIIESEEFKIELLSEGSIYIKNTEKNIGFYSFDWIFRVDFKDIYTQQYNSSFYVFPGMYAKGTKYRKQPGVQESSEGINELFYINNLQLSGKKQKKDSDSNVLMYSFNFIYSPHQGYVSTGINPDLKKILWVTSNFLDISIQKKFQDASSFKQKYEHLDSLKNYETRLFADLENYFYAFFNKSKKVVYYKNAILSDLSHIVKNIDKASKLWKVKWTEPTQYVKNIEKNLQILKSLSEYEYSITLTFLEDYYYYFTSIYPSDFSTQQHAKDIYLWLKSESSQTKENDEYLSYLFSLYNKKELSPAEVNKWIIKYITSSSRVLDPEDSRSFYYYYYAYNKILKNHIRTLGIKQEWFNDIIKVLENIAFISEWYFRSEEVKKWMLYINAEIIENILNYLSELYFESSRNADQLLVLKDNDLNISDSSILNLEKNINYFFNYQKNSQILDETKENDAALLQKYIRFQKEASEYFEAIINNDDYRNAKILGALEKYASYTKRVEEKPSIQWAKDYLSTFTQVDSSQAKIQVINENYYEIQWVKVASELMSFDLYPLEFHKITNIKKAAKWIENLSDILLTNSENDFKLKDPNNISAEELYDYLIWLGNIELYQEDISVIKDTYYSLKNINVSWTKYTFSLFPKSANTVTWVMEWLWIAYKLDNIKPDEDSRDFVRASEEYKNFFVELVSKTKLAEKELVILWGEDKKNSDEENIFKNDFLFGKNWDFTEISNVINLNYDTVDVRFSDGKYTTEFSDVTLLGSDAIPRNEKGELVKAKVSSQYVIAESRSYFKNMKLQFYFIRDSEDDLRYDFSKQKMQILWTVNIENFKDFYNKIWGDYKKISAIHDIKNKIIWETTVTTFRYSPSSRDAIITYLFKGDIISISFQKWEVLKIRYGNQVFEWDDLNRIENVFKLFL